jgi:hypothetical protein
MVASSKKHSDSEAKRRQARESSVSDVQLAIEDKLQQIVISFGGVVNTRQSIRIGAFELANLAVDKMQQSEASRG